MAILVTGGLGYIGSHVVVELIGLGKEVVIVDNLSNSDLEVLSRIRKITGVMPTFYEVDLRDYDEIDDIIYQEDIDSVMHFAGMKAVGESERIPLSYYENNVYGTMNLLRAMDNYSVNNLIFSSSACVYGISSNEGIVEETPMNAYNPYGRTKQVIEEMLMDICKSDDKFNIISLRYFNPVGAHKSKIIGEDPRGIPNNLMPYICQVASGDLSKLTIYGNDYDTADRTCERDYIHVVDLAKGHIKALEKIEELSGYNAYNLGTGCTASVKQMVDTFIKVNKVNVDYVYGDRRKGDLSKYFADSSKAERELGWKAELWLEDMCKDSWNYYKKKGE